VSAQRDSVYYRDRAEREVDATLAVPDLSVPEALAQACRILAAEGHESGLAGQITARAEEPGQFWTLRFGHGFDEATPELMVRVDDDLQPISADAMANPATRFHLWIYRTRPNVRAIVHTHPPHASALSMTGQPLKVAHMDATPFAENCAFLPKWPGLPVADDEGRIISEALGKNQSILLAHHGLLTAGDSVEQACFLAVFFERAARLQLLAQAARTIREIDPKLAREAGSFLLKPSIVRATFAYWARRARQSR
jgi:L-fuculose-phosphate aldolase